MPRKLLIVFDDELVTRQAVRSELAERWRLLECDTWSGAVQMLAGNEDVAAVLAHLNSKRGRAGAEFMIEASRHHPRARRLLYSRWAAGESDARVFAHEFLVHPWPPGTLYATLRRLVGTPIPPAASGAL